MAKQKAFNKMAPDEKVQSVDNVPTCSKIATSLWYTTRKNIAKKKYFKEIQKNKIQTVYLKITHSMP